MLVHLHAYCHVRVHIHTWTNTYMNTTCMLVTSHHITSHHITGILGRIASFLTAVPGGYIGDKFGRLNVVRYIQLGALVCPFLIMANTSSWTVILGKSHHIHHCARLTAFVTA